MTTGNPLRPAALALVGLVCVGGLPSAADELPNIPSPPNFVEAAHENQRLRDLASIGHPASEKLIGVYLEPSDLNDFVHTGRIGGAIVCRAYLEGEYASPQEAKAAFQKTVAALRRESGPLDLSDPDQARIIEGYRRATQEFFSQLSATPVDVRAEQLIDEPDSYGSTVTAAFDVTPLVRINIAASVVWMRIGRQILQISVLGRVDDDRAPAETEVTILHWMVIIKRVTPAVTYSDDRFVEVDEDERIETFDLKTVTRLLPGKYLVTSTQTYPPDVMKQKLAEQDVLERYCDRSDGKYPAPSGLFTLGPADMPVKDIEVATGSNGGKLVRWRVPYQRFASGDGEENLEASSCPTPGREQEVKQDRAWVRAEITNGAQSRHMYDCRRGLHMVLPVDLSSADIRSFLGKTGTIDDVLQTHEAYPVQGAYRRYYVAVCRKLGDEPYLPEE